MTKPRDDWDELDAAGEVPVIIDAATRAIRASLQQRLEELRAEQTALDRRDGDQEPRPQYGKRIGDHTSEALEQRTSNAASASLARTAAEIERALAKLDLGTYGRCDSCDRSIDPERLGALPWATQCLSCRQRQDTTRRWR